MIRDMLFPTKFTSLINTRGLIDSASLENHHNNRPNIGSQEWPKTFLGGVNVFALRYVKYTTLHRNYAINPYLAKGSLR